ncbi:glycoside hydrolase family 13 protein [Dermabacteraceae bacterium TAE3-ERU27]|nr:glycoside hydrolase family 13 protein [Dermabacteraceae bacterium TAE3-ERU27]
MTAPWWRDAVVYQVYPRSFADANGDGMGDLKGITSRLDHLEKLGVDAIWLSPFFTSPQNDGGYDVADYCDVDPRFGTLADFDEMLARAKERNIRIIIDLVPNHCSSEHPLFQKALAAAPGSPEREMFMFREGRGENGELPPNNWESIFHGDAWTRVKEADGSYGQWCLHLFDTSQPDWNWENPKVREMFRGILRFWLDRGVAGMRIDVAHGMIKAEGLPDTEVNAKGLLSLDSEKAPPYFDQDGVHEIYRDWRKIINEYPGDRVLVAECCAPRHRMPLYIRPDELHQAFNFSFLLARWDKHLLRDAIEKPMQLSREVNGSNTWVLSNHDVIRHVTRYGYAPDYKFGEGLSRDEPAADRELGLRRARAVSLAMLSLPGSAYLYQGEELGLEEVADIPDELREDPAHKRAGVPGRDGCRVPMAWQHDAPAYGFSETGKSWLPQPASYGERAADLQVGVPGSTFEMYRAAIALRRELKLGEQEFALRETGEDTLVFSLGAVTVVINLADKPLALSALGLENTRIALSSSPVEESSGTIPGNCAVWLTPEL